MFHGKGVYTKKNDGVYTCSFKYGKMTGEGTVEYSNGDRYEGDLLDFKKHGKGKLILKDKEEQYEGHFQNDLYDGIGTLTLKNGEISPIKFWVQGN